MFVDNTTRTAAWELLARHVGPAKLQRMAIEIGPSDAIEHAPKVIDGQVRGRTVVNVNR